MLRAIILAALALCVGLTGLTTASYAETKARAKMILDRRSMA